ncbi:RimJ/RimL family protein N-acetyltransferase [Thermosporothrix hazakensis]|jgi:RimJ/RimL family protein N-acetyltransferase|uniref:RimJ/RimL family protein N-acetyltransferase n=1 Tax=Thermosporothrix hazakensis TaxID=644383 RepID=A0A326U9Z3_THEHA|nr:GNAT family protein [Thermosporothrix hazakensis]PZW29304.1 RimJ/RimL family protein N-acetyltransferase [Thermosporothrix hazakensis]GCE45345.1 hypothetical protein KTH_02140 [Thermosporothrix hazakensis]
MQEEKKRFPRFELPVRRAITRYGVPNSELVESHYMLQSLEDGCSESDAERLEAICNEELIYERLFRNRLHGQPYTRAHAEAFLLWAREGWAKWEWFVFVVRDPQGQIVAALDIKSADPGAAEIGYWASVTSRGVMTNAVVALCQVAQDAGYACLYAHIAPDNGPSLGVVRRAGFQPDGEVQIQDQRYLKWTRKLM